MITQELVEYIRKRASEGVSKEIIRAELKAGSWNDKDITDGWEVLAGRGAIASKRLPWGKIVAVLVFGLLIAGGYYAWSKGYVDRFLNTENVDLPADAISSQKEVGANESGSPEEILATGYKKDLSTYFTPELTPNFYLRPQERNFSGSKSATALVVDGNISFISSWGKLQSAKSIGGNHTFTFEGSRGISFYKHDDTSAVTKTVDTAMTANEDGWMFPSDFTDEVRSLLAEQKIITRKDLIDYSLALNAGDILTDTNHARVIINYSFLQRVKNSLMREDAVAIDKFKTDFLEGYVITPVQKTDSIILVVFTSSGNLYTGSMYNKEKFTNTDVETFAASLKIDD